MNAFYLKSTMFDGIEAQWPSMKHTAQIMAIRLAAALSLAISVPAQAATWTVLNLDDPGADTLREAIQKASSGDIIQFNAGLSGTLTISSGSLNITSDVSIVGTGATNITINGNAGSRIFTATNVSPIISGLTFSNGLAVGSDGGALYQAGGDVVCSNCVFLNNRAMGSDGAAGGFGGAVFTTGGVITVRECVFSNNTAVGPRGLPAGANNRSGGGGGGAGLGGALCLFQGTGYIYQCLFNTNSATGGIGGTAGYGSWPVDGGRGGGLAGGVGGDAGTADGAAAGAFSGGGGGRDNNGGARSFGNGGSGGFGGGGGGGGANDMGGVGGSGGTGGQYGGSGAQANYSGGAGGGGGVGLGGAIFTDNSAIICSNVSLSGNCAVKGSGGGGAVGGTDGMGAGGGIFCYSNTAVTMIQITFSNNTADTNQNISGAPGGSIGEQRWMDYRIKFYGVGGGGGAPDDPYAGILYPTNTAADGVSRWTYFNRTNAAYVQLMSTNGLSNGVYLKAFDYADAHNADGWNSASNSYDWIATNAAMFFIYTSGANSNRLVVTNLPGANYQVDLVSSYGVTTYKFNEKLFAGVWTNGQSVADGSWGTNASANWQNPGGGGNNLDVTNFYHDPSRYVTWSSVVPSNGAFTIVQWNNNWNFLNCMRIRGFESRGVAPSSGSVAGGYQVVISGSNLCDGYDATNVTLCGASVAAITYQSPTQLIVTAGPGSAGLGDVAVYSVSYGMTVASNAFTYVMDLAGCLNVLGTNGAAIASGEAASAAKGTDFGSLTWGQARTNTLSVTNSGGAALTIFGVTTNGAGAAAFEISDLRCEIPAGGASNFTVTFNPPAAGVYTAAVTIANDSTNASAFALYLAGTGAKQSQAALIFAPASPQIFNTTNALSVSGGSGTGAVSYAVLGGPGQIVDATNLLATGGTGVITVRVAQAEDDLYLSAAATAEVTCARASQAITFPAIPPQHQTNTVGLAATASSSLPVSFDLISGPGSLDGTNLSFTATGVVLVAARQAGNTNWNAAASVTNSINVGLPLLVMLGTNGAALADNEIVSRAKGTEFGAIMLYSAVTNTLVVSNAGTYALTINGISTSGPGAAAFSVPALPATVSPGGASNINVVFCPAAMGSYTSMLTFANNSTAPAFRVNLAGSVSSRVVWTSTPVTNATDGEVYTYQLSGFDPLGRDLSFFAAALPSWLSIVQTGGSYIVSTVAGNGTYGSSGDGGAATNASLCPYGICLDAAGNLYISDIGNYRVRKIGTNGIISTYAGNGSWGYSGDGGPATNAKIQYVYGLTTDSQTNLYLADNGNYRVRKVIGTNGIISTFAGKGGYGFSGDGGLAINADISPYGIYADASNRVWITDWNNYRIRRVEGGIIGTVGGNGSYNYSGDGGLATNAGMQPREGQLNADGEFIFTDNSSCRIRRIGANGMVNTLTVLTNLVTNAYYYYAYAGGLSLDRSGNIFFTMPEQHKIYRIAAGTSNAVCIAGNPVIPTDEYYYHYYWCEGGYSGDGGPALQAQFNGPQSLCVDAQGNVYVADAWNYRVRKLTPSGGGWVLRGTPGPGEVGPTNITLYVSNGDTNTPQTFTLTVAGRARPALKGADGQTLYDNAAASAAAGTDYGTVGTNEAREVTLAITNYGTADMIISGVATSGSGAACFSISNLPAVVSCGGASNFTVNFAPDALGTLAATFALTNNGTSTPFRVNVAGCGVKPGEIGLNKAFLTYTAVYGGANPAAQSWILTNKGDIAFSFTNTVAFSGGGSGWFTTDPANGTLNSSNSLVHTGTVDIAGLDAGVYLATNTITATAMNSPVELVTELQIAQATQAISFTELSTQQVGAVIGLAASASSGLPVSFAVANGSATISGGTNLACAGEGFVTLLVAQTGDVNYTAAPTITNTFRVVKSSAGVYINGTLTNVYDGAVKSVTATTMPAGLSVTITYDGNTNAPSNAGIYTVLAQVFDTNYSGSANATLTITKAPANVYLGGLSNVYDGLAKNATATTMPAGVTTELRYNDGLAAPSNAGSYTVTGQIADGNYTGGATGTMTIAKGNQTITFPAIPDQTFTNTVALSATASSALPVSFGVVGGPGQINSGTNLTFTAAGQVLVSASQAGDGNWNAAASVTNSITVTAARLFVLGTNGALIANGAAANITNGTDFGGVAWGGALTNTFALTNSGSESLMISSWTTNGAGAASFEISDLRFEIPVGGVSNFTVVFRPSVVGVYTATLVVANNSTDAMYLVNLAGTGSKGSQAPLVFNPSSPQAYNTTSTLSAAGGSGAGTLSYSVQAGPGQIVGAAGLRASSGTGIVTVVATKASDSWFASASATAQVVCARSGQTISFAAIADQFATNTVRLAATADSGLPVSFTLAGGPGQITGATNLAFTGAGQVSIAAAQSGNTNFNAAPGITNTFNVSKAWAAVTLGGLTQTYNGAARSATATTVPPGLAVTFTYNGVTNQPVNVGSYAVTGAVVSALYEGWTNGALTIGAAPVMVYLANLNHTYDGAVKSATATSMPSGLTLSITYNGGASAPADAGAYAVTARVVDVNYSGLTNGVLNIAKQTQTVSFASIADQIATGTVALSATASSGLPVTFDIVSGPGEMVDSTTLGFTGVGVVLARARQAGNANWESASKTNTVNVSYAAAAVTLTNLTYTYNGAARNAAAATVPAGLPVTITYNGSATAPSNAGSYAVTGAVNHALYAGTNTATLTISQTTPVIHFPHISDQYVSRIYGLEAVSDSGLPVTFSVISGPAAITGGTNLSFSTTGNVSVVASDAGNANWNATAATNTFFVHNVLIWFGGTNGQLIADGEAASMPKGTDFGNVGLTTVQTNTFSIGNEGTTNLVVTNWTTNGTGAAVFTVIAVATNVEAGGISNIVVRFAPTGLQAFTSAVVFAHNGTTNTPFTLSLSGTGVQAAALGFSVTGVTFTTAYGVNPANQPFAVTNLGQAACAFTQNVNQGAGTWLTVTPASGILDDHGAATLTAEASAVGLNVGMYNGTATVYAAVATNSPQAIPVTMIITQAPANVALGALWQVYDGNARTVTVSTLPAGLACDVTYAGSSTAPTNAGTYAVTALVNEVNYQGSVTGILTVAQSNVFVNLGNMLQVYDGAAKTSAVTTVPEGMALAVTYDGSATAPSNAGAYAVTALVTEVNYQGSAAGTLTISKSSALVYLERLSHIYDGAVKSAVATTMPSGLTVNFTYDGATNQPVNVGSYAVVGSVTSVNYNGQAGAVMTIAMADQSIVFPIVAEQYWTNRVGLFAEASSGLPVEFSVVSGPGLISGGTNLTFTEGGVVQVSADQAGDTNWNPAATVINSIGARASIMNAMGTNGALVTNGAPANAAAGTDFGGVLWGAAKTNVFALTNSGTFELLISAWITNGPNAAEFVIGGMPLAISAGSASNISVVFNPAVPGIYSVALTITNNAPYSPFVLNLAGTGAKRTQAELVFAPASPQTCNTTQILTTTGGSGTGVVTYAVLGGAGTIVSSNELRMDTGVGIVTLQAVKAADDNYNAITSAVANVAAQRAEQAALVFSPASPQVYNTTNALATSGGSGTGAVSYTVESGPGHIMGSANLWVTSGTGMVAVVAAKAADDMFNRIVATGHVAAAKATQMITFPAIADQVVTSTVVLAATADSGLPVSFAVGSGPGTISGGNHLMFTATGVVSIVAGQTGNTCYAAAPSVTNTFNVLPVTTSVSNGWLAIQVTPETGSWFLTAPAGYTGPTAGTGSLSTASAATGLYSLAWGALFGYVAPSNQFQFVNGGSTTIFAAVYLQISTNIGTPAGVLATDGTYTNKIRITWQGVTGALGYEIWRALTNDANAAGRIADIPDNSSFAGTKSFCDLLPGQVWAGGVCQRLGFGEASAAAAQIAPTAWKLGNTYIYDDYAITPISAYYYWVRAKTSSLISPMSYVGMGYASLSPEQTTGTADIAVSDLVFLPVNMINDSAAGTVSLRLSNLGPDPINAAGVALDFHMVNNASALVWIGSAQSNLTLSVGSEKLIIVTPSARRGLTARGDLSGIQQVKVVARHLAALNDPNLTNNTTTAAGSVRIKTGGVNSPGRSLNDYDGDGKADGAIYRNSDGRWYAALSGYRYQVWLATEAGMAGLTPVPGDYDGDGIADMATFNRLNGWWTARLSSTEQVMSGQFGGPGFTATPCDFDGDALTDPVLYRDADGLWAGLMSSLNYAYGESGACGSGYQPLPADYDGDGKADAAMFNPTSGMWAIGYSGWGYWLMTGPFGGTGWQAAPADYDGDGLTDPAIYNPSTAAWQILMSGSLSTEGKYTWQGGILGSAGGMPVSADYDGDGKTDIALYHQDTGIWELFLSTLGYRELSGDFGGPEYAPARE